MISQLTIFGTELELTDQPSFQGGSLASLTALRESVKRLVTSVISGQKCGELLARLSPDGLWLKTYQGCYQARMDGSFEEFSEILPRWGLMLDGQLIQPHGLEPSIDESGWRLLPTPTATLDKGYSPGTAKRRIDGVKIRKSGVAFGSSLNWEPAFYAAYRMGSKNNINPLLLEFMMGFPEQWSEITPSETP